MLLPGDLYPLFPDAKDLIVLSISEDPLSLVPVLIGAFKLIGPSTLFLLIILSLFDLLGL